VIMDCPFVPFHIRNATWSSTNHFWPLITIE
jgi:hypothetical protein